MTVLHLPPPDWSVLSGGHLEANWLASRDGKFGLSMALAGQALATERALRARNALLDCTADILRTIPGATEWYFALLHLSNKVLTNSTERAKAYGLARSPSALQRALRSGRPVEQDQLVALARWINAEIAHLFPHTEQTEDERNALASASALMHLGARADGQSRNLGGNLGVIIVKSALVEMMAEHDAIEVESNKQWSAYTPAHDLPGSHRLRFGKHLICDFTPGGDRPDIVIRLDETMIAVGEIKSRIDLSNVWESWMPQVADHLRAWAQDYPSAARLFFGTIITEGMVRGESLRGTRHIGLRELYEEGTLTAAYNLSQLVGREARNVAQFAALIEALGTLLQH